MSIESTTRGIAETRMPPDHRVTLEITALGEFRAAVNGRPVDIKSKKAQAIIVYLLLGSSAFETRGRLTGLFWGESPEENARASLRQILHGLREAFARCRFDGFTFDRERVGLDRRAVAIDVTRLIAAAEEGRIDPVLLNASRLADELLRGFDTLDPSFGEWLLIQRRLLGERLERALSRSLASNLSDDDRLTVATVLFNLQPTHEEACRVLMATLAARGEVAAALKAYKQLWDVLADECDMEPSAQTQELVVRIKSAPMAEPLPAAKPPPALPHPGLAPIDAAKRRSAAPAGVPRPERRPIVIAPFDTAGVDPQFSYLVSGFRSDLIAKLVRFREWMIVDGSNVDRSPEGRFARRWDHYILIEAAIFQVGEDLKVTLNLREEPEGVFVWGDSYRFELGRWFEIERTLVGRIATIMNLHVSTARLIASAGAPDVSLQIYDRWLRGQAIIMNWRPEREEGRAIYRSILSDAPTFSPAYSSLAQLENLEHIALPGMMRTSEREKLALEHARQAVRLDPFDSRAHLSLGWSSAMNGLFDQGVHRYQTALELNANDAWTINSAALGLAYCGHVARSVELIERSLDLGLEPSNYHWAYQGPIWFLCGDYGRAVHAFTRAENVITDMAAWDAASLAYLGRIEEARAEARRFVDRTRRRWHGPQAPNEQTILAWLLHCFPIRDRAAWERLRDGLRLTGLAIPADDTIPRHP
jgi:DNA-binding SARP family transcriptional activator/TolB-like protein